MKIIDICYIQSNPIVTSYNPQHSTQDTDKWLS